MTEGTAQGRQAAAKHAYDAYMENCPTRQVLAAVADKWTSLIVNSLAAGPRRHGELRRRIAGISQKMLTQSLRSLERNGLVVRLVAPTLPARVDYELTELGRTLLPILRALKEWSEVHIEEVLAARTVYEESTEPGE